MEWQCWSNRGGLDSIKPLLAVYPRATSCAPSATTASICLLFTYHVEKRDSFNDTDREKKKKKENQSCYASSRSGPNINSDLLSSRVNFLCLHWCTHFLRGLSDASVSTPVLHKGMEVFHPAGERFNRANSSHMLIGACLPVLMMLSAKASFMLRKVSSEFPASLLE